jgi:Pilin (bacterial filament)
MNTGVVILAGALASSGLFATEVFAAEKETPSTIDIQKHTVAIGNAMAQAVNVEQLVVAFHQRNNAFPSSNAEAGVKPGGALASPDVKSIDITGNGVVVATLTGNSGIDGGQIYFTPLLSDNPDDGVIRWRCTSPNYSTISDITGGSCDYSKLP